jgi:hypothetical protein
MAPFPDRTPQANNGNVARESVVLSNSDPSSINSSNDAGAKPDFLSQLHAVMSMSNREQRLRAFSSIVDSLSAQEVQEAIGRLLKLRAPDRDEFLERLYARWAEIDPSAAIASAQELAIYAEREKAVGAVLSGWADRDPKAAEEWVRALPDGLLKKSAWKELIGAVAVRNPFRALEWARGLPLDWIAAEEISGLIFDNWIGTDPQAASTHAVQLPPGTLRQAALRRVARQWAGKNLTEALAWAEAVPDQEYPEGAMNTVGTSPIFEVLHVWLESDASAAVRWLEQLAPGEKKASLSSSACTCLRSSGSTPEIAMQLVSMLPEGSLHDNVLRSLAQTIASWKPETALEWVRTKGTPAEKKLILSGLLSELSGDQLRAALQFAQTLDPNDRSDLIVIGAARSSWKLSDPATLAEWATHQPNNQQYLNRIAESWTSTDPQRATQWLQTLPAAARDEALSAVLEKAIFMVPIGSSYGTAANIQNAERWIAQLANDATRQASYEKLAKRWLQTDSDSASAWIATSPLSAEAKQRLLAKKP